MGDQVIALKDKSNGVIAVGVPVTVRVLRRGDVTDIQLAAGIPVQTAYDVEKGSFTAPGGTENGYKLVFPEADGNIPQCGDIPGRICFGNA